MRRKYKMKSVEHRINTGVHTSVYRNIKKSSSNYELMRDHIYHPISDITNLIIRVMLTCKNELISENLILKKRTERFWPPF